ncbi:MAG: hypothetical protein NVV74_25345 [Magnetospirillum sp.]|nr:hypothetical protein [Magnetospirillum sp.]
MDSALGMVLVYAVMGVAAWTLTVWWLGEPRARPAPRVAARPTDAEPHTLTLLGPSGRPNPLRYERFPCYAAALARQRELARQGRASVVVHADSGEVRLDMAGLLEPYGRISF